MSRWNSYCEFISMSINPLESGIKTKTPIYWQRKVFCEIIT